MRTITLLTATVTTGLMAGLYFAFACAVMLGLHRTDDRTFVQAMHRINIAILNGWFAIAFAGSLITAVASVLLEWRATDHRALPWVIVGAALYTVGFIVTMALNVPLNNHLVAAADRAGVTDFAGIRAAFETSWNAWNIVRTVVTTGGLVSLSWALVLHGRITARA